MQKSYFLCAEKSFSQALGMEQKFSINYLTNMQQLFVASIWWGVSCMYGFSVLCLVPCVFA
jgi:hypothetical protein